jgi:hypothetical protein
MDRCTRGEGVAADGSRSARGHPLASRWTCRIRLFPIQPRRMASCSRAKVDTKCTSGRGRLNMRLIAGSRAFARLSSGCIPLNAVPFRHVAAQESDHSQRERRQRKTKRSAGGKFHATGALFDAHRRAHGAQISISNGNVAEEKAAQTRAVTQRLGK